MATVGIEPTKIAPSDLKSDPLTTRASCLAVQYIDVTHFKDTLSLKRQHKF